MTSRTICQYALPPGIKRRLSMPKGAIPLTVQVQAGTPCLWALVNPDAPRVAYETYTVATGEPLISDICVPKHYLGSFQFTEGGLVFHCFLRRCAERGKKA